MTAPGAARTRWRRRVRRRQAPVRLSAAVISYNTATWLPDCLDSMLAQDVDDVQIVVVDDGSTDESVRIVQEYAARYRGIELVRQQNGGVSAAGTPGIARCTGEYLTLVDSDDRVTPGAWSRMLATLEATGSDLVIGAAERVDGERRFTTPLMERNHRVERLGITDRVPAADAGRRLRLEQDLPSVVLGGGRGRLPRSECPTRTSRRSPKILLAAERFDVLPDVVYERHVRSDRSSATQQRGSTTNLRHRIETKQMTDRPGEQTWVAPAAPGALRRSPADRHVGALPGGARVHRRVLDPAARRGARDLGRAHALLRRDVGAGPPAAHGPPRGAGSARGPGPAPRVRRPSRSRHRPARIPVGPTTCHPPEPDDGQVRRDHQLGSGGESQTRGECDRGAGHEAGTDDP